MRALGPEAISTVVLQRLKRLPASAPAMARAVAILGEGAKPARRRRARRARPDTAEEALDALCRADILTRDEHDRLGFVHPIVLSAVYTDLPVATRSDGHARAARLRRRRPRRSPRTSSARAPRGDAVGGRGAARRRRRARSRSAIPRPPSPTSSARWQEPPPEPRAPPCWPSSPAPRRSPAARPRRSTSAPAMRAQRRPARARPDRDRPRPLPEVPRRLARARSTSLRHALAELDPTTRWPRSSRSSWSSSAYICARRAAAARRRDRPHRGARRPSRTQLDRLHLMVSAFETAIAAGPAERRRRATPAARSPAATSRPTSAPAGTCSSPRPPCWCGPSATTRPSAPTTRPSPTRAGAARASASRPPRACARGCTTASAACRRPRPTRPPRSTCATTSRARRATSRCALNALVFTRLERGEADHELLALVDDFFATQPSEDLPYGLAIHARGWLRAALGDPEGGLEELLACGEREQQWGVGTPQIVAWRSAAAEVCLTLGRLDQARELVDEELDAGAPDRRAARDRRRAARRGAGRVGRAADRAAHRGRRDAGALRGRARARPRPRRSRPRAGPRRPPRRRPRAPARRAGARVRAAARRLLVERAHRELLATGARPRRTAAAGRDELTPSERRVTQMAAEGLTNREIAQALFVTEKTVETHLGRAFVKLGVRSRKQLGGCHPDDRKFWRRRALRPAWARTPRHRSKSARA